MSSILNNCEECPNCLECSKKSPVFSQLSDHDLEELNTNRYEVAYSAGEILFKQGAAMSHLLSLTSGFVALYLENETSKQILKICKPFELIGGLGLFHENRYHYTAIALNDVRVCFLDGNVFIPVLQRSPILSEAYLKQIATETFLLQNLISNLSSKSIKQRIGECLLQIESIQSPINTAIFDPRLMASMANCAKDNIVRTLREFEKEGLIKTDTGQIFIINRPSLPL